MSDLYGKKGMVLRVVKKENVKIFAQIKVGPKEYAFHWSMETGQCQQGEHNQLMIDNFDLDECG